MLTKCLTLCEKGHRSEQLDRFFYFQTRAHTISVLIDGFSQCHASPHYVDYLGEQLMTIHYAQLDSDGICNAIEQILNTNCGYPGKASIAIIVSDEKNYRYLSLGDTRIYWPTARKRTQDHTLAQRCVEQGKARADVLRTHPLRNRVTQFVSKETEHAFCYHTNKCIPGEPIFMCTDGFWSEFDDEILYTFRSEEALCHAFEQISSSETGESDNVSVVMLTDYSAE